MSKNRRRGFQSLLNSKTRAFINTKSRSSTSLKRIKKKQVSFEKESSLLSVLLPKIKENVEEIKVSAASDTNEELITPKTKKHSTKNSKSVAKSPKPTTNTNSAKPRRPLQRKRNKDQSIPVPPKFASQEPIQIQEEPAEKEKQISVSVS